MRIRLARLCFVAMLSVSSSVALCNPARISGCIPIVVEDVSRFDPPRFEQFAAPISREKPVQADTKSPPIAHRYRTELRTQATRGPDFAGHYTIAGWGCGSSCLQFAIIDALTGKVYFPPHITSVSSVHVGDSSPQKFNSLRYRLDSRLLVVLGAINEDTAQEGIGYYVWTGTALEQIRWFGSDKKWCGSGGDG